MTTPELSISLTDHILSLLVPLSPHLPSDLHAKVAPYLDETKVEASTDVSTVPTISYSLLLELSRWVRTANVAEIDPRQYTMINLLAGSTTSPNARFTPYESATAEDEGKRAKDEKRAIATLLNVLFSVVGSGAAVWMVTGNRGWSVESRASMSLGTALFVALSEATLFLILQAGKDKAAVRRKRVVDVRHKKDEGESSGNKAENSSEDKATSTTLSSPGQTRLVHRHQPDSGSTQT